MTSATDVLRRMLDERGVKWWEDAFSGEHRTVFDGKDGVRYCVYQLGSSLFISSILPVNPEQAIAATLGAETCRIECHYGEWYCTSCGEMVGTCDPDSELCVDGNYVSMWSYCPNCGRKVVDE